MEHIEIVGHFPRLSRCAVTLGKFDGIHQGHRKLIRKILEQKENGLPSVLFAFVTPGNTIYSRAERREILADMGVDILLECPLDERVRHMRAETFIKEVLAGDLRAAYVAVGEDFRFGYGRKGTPALLQEAGKKYGFEAEVLPKEMDGHRKISSTYIREELRRGNMEKVSALLGEDFFVRGIVAHGMGIGHKMLFPTVNLLPSPEKLMPPNGVYVTETSFEHQLYFGITNVGYKPTVGEKFLGVETHLFDCDSDLYGQMCTVRFKKFLRPEYKFESIDALKEQIRRDISGGRSYLAEQRV